MSFSLVLTGAVHMFVYVWMYVCIYETGDFQLMGIFQDKNEEKTDLIRGING